MFTEQDLIKSSKEYFDGDELAAGVFDKYVLKDKQGNILESNPDDMHKRLAKEFARIEDKFGGDEKLSEEEIYSYLKNFRKIVPQGSPMYGIGNEHVNVSLSNCVVVAPPKDNIASIVDSGKQLANLFARRCGVGIDISTLRPENARVGNSAGTSTGAWSFADFYSYVCRMIGQNNRRGALMISMDVRHPDIEKFVTMKHNLEKVTGANVSVKVSDEFMRAVEKEEDFELHFPIGAKNPKYVKTVKAKELWDLVVTSATQTAEPGLLMWDNIVNNLPAECYDDFKTSTVNPCGEIPLSPYDSCRLVSINLKPFVKNAFEEAAFFDFKEFRDTVRVAMRLSDDLVELEIEKLEHIVSIVETLSEQDLWESLLKACRNGRRTGLGTHGLADAIACMGIPYDSDGALNIIENIYKTLRDAAYGESVELAKERGVFPVFDWDKERNNSYIKKLPNFLRDKISRFGRRNISLLTNAPTGSVSILSQTSSGIEPVFRNWYIRRRKLNHDQINETADFIDDLGDKWREYKVFHHNIEEWKKKHKLNGEAQIPEFFTTSDQINPFKRVEIQAIIQNYIDHSISSTINLPRGTLPELVGQLYFDGWKKGLKGITVYVDGSRTGVLITEDKKEEFPQWNAPKRPKELECDIHHTTIQGEPWTILVGIYNNKPYEVMGGKSDLIEIPKKFEKGLLIKHSRKTTNSRYDLKFGDNGDEVVIKDIVRVFDNPNHSSFTRMLSLSLRHGAKTQFLVEQLMKDRESDMFSFAKCIARVIKKYIAEGERVNGVSCTECGADLIYIEGCQSCMSCGFAKCG